MDTWIPDTVMTWSVIMALLLERGYMEDGGKMD